MRFRYAMVCWSNQNQSTEAHALLKRQGLDVASYGTGSHRNGVLQLAPQRWQDNAGDGVFDVVMTFEEKVFDSVLEAAAFDITFILRLKGRKHGKILSRVLENNRGGNLFIASHSTEDSVLRC
ncbi:hypothetical protein Bca4012_057798 [Brassica carinata]